MGKRQAIAVLSVILLTVSGCWSAELSFQVVQHNGAQENVCEQTLVIEDEMLDYFFNQGNIVTNERAAALKDGGDEAVWKAAFADAAAGGSQYFVQLRLYYDTSSSTNPEAVALSNLNYVTWTITKIQSGEKIADMKDIVDKTDLGKNDTDSVKNYAAEIAGQIQKALKVKA